MTNSTYIITPKQQRYLSLLQQATTEQVSIVQIAKQHNIDPSLLYAARKSLRQKGILPSESQPLASKFQSVAMPRSSSQHIELKTQLSNGQPVWLSVPVAQLALALKALSA